MEDWKSFILDRTQFQSKEWSFNGYSHRNVFWFSPNNVEELKTILERDPFTYICYIVPENHKGNIENFNYFIHVAEHLEDEQNQNEEFRGMFIEERVTGNFHKFIFQKLKERFNIKK